MKEPSPTRLLTQAHPSLLVLTASTHSYDSQAICVLLLLLLLLLLNP